MAIDPGKTRGTATDLGTLSLRRLREKVGGSDKLDFYKFTLTGSTNFSARLRGLKNNADMRLLNSSGALLLQNKKPGTQNESINALLSAGTYYLRVRGGSKVTPYTLRLSANPSPNTAPTLSGSLALNALRGNLNANSTAIASSVLNATDTQQNPTQLTYTITTAPKQGSVFRNGVLLNVGDIFTQLDVNNNLISYQQQAIKPLPNSTGITSNVVISGKNAAWLKGTGTSTEVFFYNGTTGVTTQLTNDSLEDDSVNISGDTVVWATRFSSTDRDIKYSVNGSAAASISGSSANDSDPAISGRYIAFKRNDNSGVGVAGDGVYLFDLNTTTTTQVRGDTEEVYSIGVSSTPTGANVVWERRFGSEGDIQYSINGGAFQSINFSSNNNDFSPQISGQYIAFRRNDLSGTNVAGDGVYLFDTSTPATAPVQLQADTEQINSIRMSGNNVVWERSYGSESDVRYSIAGGTARAIDSSTSLTDYNPYISGSNIVFQRNQLSGDTTDGTYLFDAANPTAAPIRLSTTDSDFPGGIDGRNVAFRSGSQALFYDGTTTSDSFGFTVSDGALSTTGTLNISIG